MKTRLNTTQGNSSNCTAFQNSLKAYHDDELPVIERLSIRLHLFKCPACREEIELMEKITNDLRTADSAILEPGLRSRLLDGIPASAATDESEKKRFRFRRPNLEQWKKKPRIVWATAAIACILLFVFQVTPKLIDRQQDYSLSHSLSSSPGTPVPEVDSSSEANTSASIVGNPTIVPMSRTPAPGDMETSKIKQRTDIATKADRKSFDTNSPEVSPNYFASGSAAGKMMAGRVPGGMPAPKTSSEAFNPTSRAAPQRQVHREASLILEVDKLEEISGSIEDMVKATGGYIATNDLTSSDDGTKSASLVAKVPVDQFDETMGKLSKLGSIKAKSVNGEDLTEKISDSHQEEKSLNQQIEEAKQRLAHLKGNGARRDEAENIRDLRVQEAQAEGRLELLKKMARLSTISIELHEKSKTQAAPQQSGFVTDMK